MREHEREFILTALLLVVIISMIVVALAIDRDKMRAELRAARERCQCDP